MRPPMARKVIEAVPPKLELYLGILSHVFRAVSSVLYTISFCEQDATFRVISSGAPWPLKAVFLMQRVPSGDFL